jgi:hypothetical protein
MSALTETTECAITVSAEPTNRYLIIGRAKQLPFDDKIYKTTLKEKKSHRLIHKPSQKPFEKTNLKPFQSDNTPYKNDNTNVNYLNNSKKKIKEILTTIQITGREPEFKKHNVA